MFQKNIESSVEQKRCRNCDSENLEWGVYTLNSGGAVDGRLKMHDFQCEFFLGCQDCSETILVVSADDIANVLPKTSQNNLKLTAAATDLLIGALDVISKIDDCCDGKINFRRDFADRLRTAVEKII